MLQILRAYDIPGKLVKAIGLMYEDTKARVLTPDGITEYFDIHAGVLQGDTLAPYLFTIVLDYAMRTAIAGSKTLLEERRNLDSNLRKEEAKDINQ